MQWYNSKTNELQSNTPWQGYLNPDLQSQIYSDWAQVADGFTPPTPTLTEQQKLDALDAEYQPQFDDLALRMAKAQCRNDTTLIATLQTKYSTLESQYSIAREAIN